MVLPSSLDAGLDGKASLVVFAVEGTHFSIGGAQIRTTRKYKNIVAGHRKVSLIIDDLRSIAPWEPRAIKIPGIAEIVERAGHSWRGAFPGLVSYSRFVELIPSVLIPLAAYLESCCGACNGLSFVDSTQLAVGHNRCIQQQRGFAGLAERGKTSVDWLYGFKLHLVGNDCGELLTCWLTPGNVDDRRPVSGMPQELFGKLIGDKGSLSQELVATVLQHGVELIPHQAYVEAAVGQAQSRGSVIS